MMMRRRLDPVIILVICQISSLSWHDSGLSVNKRQWMVCAFRRMA
ncbi:Uncharacterized protein ChrSV_3485 [Chromobacterium vaccinii]|nr:Uncharacterized protein ChrSW_3485 [Chromobacterium vaccinii]QND90942.1 Uncharacterized protein ChrSV_3485 [Chromobacterium vaccinii]